MQDFELYLKNRLLEPLPGQLAQKKMEPVPTDFKVHRNYYDYDENEVRKSGVLVPLISGQNDVEVVLTLRSNNIIHGGQISFPGGGLEQNETFVEAALREANEEIGLAENEVEILGQLTSLYISHSENLVEPIVGFIGDHCKFIADPGEVAEVFKVSLNELIDQNNIVREQWNLHNRYFEVPYWKIHHVPLWGATAMMMSELVEIYREYLKIMHNSL